MNHRIVSSVVTLIGVLFVAIALMFALVIDVREPTGITSLTAKPVPHPVAGEAAACGECHTLDDDSLPLTHRYYSWATCEGCHALAHPQLVPHDTSTGVARCLLCHGDPTSDGGVPMSHLAYPKDRCLFCHPPIASEANRLPKPIGELAIPKPAVSHGVSGAFENCLYCHEIGGTPPMPPSHWGYEAKTCLWCHEVGSSETTALPSAN